MTRFALVVLTLGVLATATHAESLEAESRPTIAHGYVSLGGLVGLDE
ncbi:MAG: hypothetical protein JNL83_30325, partial [Myxococcales bacterium]|nr:hypothetical protein [Myxococcales bacterium]